MDAAEKFEIDPEILQGFVAESLEGFASIDEKLVRLEQDPSDRANIDFIFRVVHSVKGNAGFFGLNGAKIIAHRLENLLDDIRNSRRKVTPQGVGILLKGIDYLRSMFIEVAETQTPRDLRDAEQAFLASLEAFLAENDSSVFELKDLLLEIRPFVDALREHQEAARLTPVVDMLRILSHYEEKARRPQAGADAPVAGTDANSAVGAPAASERGDAKVKKTMRVDEATIDGFMSYIGDLIVASEAFNYLQQKVESVGVDAAIVKEFKNANIAFNGLSQNLQKSLMEVRKVPLKNLFSKAPRLVRDLATNLGKEVKVEIVGEDLAVDKSLVEALEDPFVHMIRNSLDHGIEKPEARRASGKTVPGVLRIEARNDKSFLYISISDDGAGIHPERIRKLAVKKGLRSESEAASLSDRDAIQLIFAPGFSSAESISEVSGRGVGMDVVLTNIKRVNGTIDVESTPGVGTKMQLKLPLGMTVIVIPALLVGVGAESFIVPLDGVREVAHLDPTHLGTIRGDSEVVRFRDTIYPLVRLERLLSVAPPESVVTESVIVFVEKDGERMAVLVDRLLGLQQVVLKSLGDSFGATPMLGGAAVLGDGSVGLVLDVKGMFERTFRGGRHG